MEESNTTQIRPNGEEHIMNLTTNNQSTTYAALTSRPAWQLRALAIVAAVVLNIVVLAVARLIIGDYPIAAVNGDDQTIGFAQVAFVTAMSGLVGWGLLGLRARTAARPVTAWTIIAIIAFGLSMLGPIDGAVNTSSLIVLTIMHIVAAAIIIPAMRNTSASGL
jgi:hypothetical protein